MPTVEYKDYSTRAMAQLWQDVKKIREEVDDDEIYNYALVDELDPADYGWERSTLGRALTALRVKVDREGAINVEEENSDKIANKKKWVFLDVDATDIPEPEGDTE